jgi:hypothetical protein
MNTSIMHRSLARALTGLAAIVTIAAAGPAAASAALTYTSGDILYVAYQYPNGPNYIVDLGPRANFTGAVTTITLSDVMASDLNGVIGAAAPDIWVGLFGVATTGHDGILSANGPLSDLQLSTASIAGAANQIESFGNGVAQLSLAVPSANPRAGMFASSGSTGSYQSTLDVANAGSLGSNIEWNVETQLSNDSGVRNPAPVNIPFFLAIKNPFSGVTSHAVVGFFTLRPDGTLTYFPDADGDFIADDIDLCPGVSSPDNSDADGDHHAPACDCNPTNGTVWGVPGEVPSVAFNDATHFSWTVPANPGGTAPAYDVLLAPRTSFVGAPVLTCSQPDLGGLTATDTNAPPAGQVFLYLIRDGNSCGEGPAGTGSNGQPLPAPSCP